MAAAAEAAGKTEDGAKGKSGGGGIGSIDIEREGSIDLEQREKGWDFFFYRERGGRERERKKDF